MMRRLGTIGASTVIGLFLALHGFAAAADIRQSMKLSDAELDKVAAGAFVTAGGSGSAKGDLARTEAVVSSVARSVGNVDGKALGQVSAIAISSPGSLSSASSTLHLSVSSP